MEWSGKTVLVTGADGFIGSHLVQALQRQGCQVRALAYYNAFNRCGWLDSLQEADRRALDVVSGDIRDAQQMHNIVQGCDVIFHLAALIAIPYSYQAAESYVATNVQGTLNLLNAAKQHGIEKFIHTSTSEVYGTAQTVPIDETHPLQAQSPYAATKIAADQLALSYYHSFELPVVVARPFNTYGPRQSARAVIPTIISQMAAGETTIKLGALTPTRDLSYVNDTVSGLLAIAASDKVMGEVLNLGSQFEIAIGDLAKLIAEIMQVTIDIQCDTQRLRPDASEVQRLFASHQKVRRLTTWQPEYASYAGLQKGLEKTIHWFTQAENLSLYKPKEYNV